MDDTGGRQGRGAVARVMLWALEAYRLLLGPWIGQSCRFEPTCSRYAKEAIEQHGAAAGAYLATRRLLRCHPWCEAGHDPVPDTETWPERSSRARALVRFLNPTR